jgi:predicted kinase
MPTLLIVVCGLSGTERAPLAIGLAQALDAVYLRIDTIERAFTGPTTPRDDATEATACSVAHAVAEDNLRLGRVVVADGMGSVASTRFAWKSVSQRIGVPVFEVELFRTDENERRARVAHRYGDVDARTVVASDEPLTIRDDPWCKRIAIDAAQRPLAESVTVVHALLLAHARVWR